MEINRRSFLLGTSALAFSGCVTGNAKTACDPKALRLKFGVLSDIHITDWASTEIFRKTLRYFRSQDVDAVLIAGDMADHGLISQLENVAKAWFEVFPNDRGLNDKHVERLFVYGNHDAEGLCYRDGDMDKAFKAMGITYEEAEKQTMFKLGMAKCWEQCFHEPYSQIYMKSVKGYKFIGGHWDNDRGDWKGMHDLEDWFAKHSAEIPTDRPFFYFQHGSPMGTVYGHESWGDDWGMSTRCLAQYPNAVAFSGHSHRPLTDERSYWREEFTSIGTSTLSYVCPPPGRENFPDYRTNLDCRQGQIVSVFDDRLEILRRDFINDENLDGIITIPMHSKVSSFAVRGVTKSNLPAFPKDAKAEVKREGDTLVLTFPGAFENPSARPFDYKAAFVFNVADKEGKTRDEYKTYYFFQPSACFSRARAAAEPIRFVLPADKFPKDFLKAKVTVFPRNCYGIWGEHLPDAFI